MRDELARVGLRNDILGMWCRVSATRLNNTEGLCEYMGQEVVVYT